MVIDGEEGKEEQESTSYWTQNGHEQSRREWERTERGDRSSRGVGGGEAKLRGELKSGVTLEDMDN